MRTLLAAAAAFLFVAGCGDLGREEATLDGFTTSDWIEKAQSEDAEARREAVQKLGELGPDESDKTVPALMQALKDGDVEVRFYAVNSLGQLGPKAKRASSALGRAINDKDKRVSKAAMKVWKDIEMAKPSALNGH